MIIMFNILYILFIAKDLVQRMLKTDPNKRIELKHALEHPWIKNRDVLRHFEGRNKKE